MQTIFCSLNGIFISSQVKGGSAIQRNCWRLVKASKSSQEAEKLFEMLTSYGYCKPSNALLGPVVKFKFIKYVFHLSLVNCCICFIFFSGEYEEAVQAFSNYAKKYRCTPMKVELLRALLKSNKNELFDEVVQIDQNLHGPLASSLSVVAALAEEGFTKALRNYFLVRYFTFRLL